MVSKTEAKNIEKIARARAKLEIVIDEIKAELEGLLADHHIQCPAEDLTGFPAACNCGADKKNTKIQSIISKLENDGVVGKSLKELNFSS